MLNAISSLSTLVAALIAAITLIMGSCQFQQTQKLAQETLHYENESKAVDLYIKFNEINAKISEASEHGDNLNWRKNNLLSITEALHNITETNENWLQTVEWMISVQREFLESNSFECETYTDSFIKILEKNTNLICDKQS
ncbi:hypothetical protein LMK08_21320 [Metapseudomonas furukawaii]|uniref:hypothetical protein n=1 Tax=Metapseudomonas furukawaii TaxID=1149133 RepID=UPI00227AD864|nr:hypothetical protein [Pseudomonas furukawaii]WAG77879.1 hypothetical protein LMK08_21320 [Pseudomonas furukawaii]